MPSRTAKHKTQAQPILNQNIRYSTRERSDPTLLLRTDARESSTRRRRDGPDSPITVLGPSTREGAGLGEVPSTDPAALD